MAKQKKAKRSDAAKRRTALPVHASGSQREEPMTTLGHADPGNGKRRELIRQLQGYRGSRVICYITGDRAGLETRIAHDAHPLIFSHLLQLPPGQNIDLFLYTRGGITVAGWALVHLIREFSRKFAVLVPYKAWSCGTLVCLGADEIVMGRLGQLGPIDPSTTNPFNPPLPATPPGVFQTIPMNVEDVMSFIKLAKEEVGLKQEVGLTATLECLSKMNPYAPLALGAAHRIRPQIAKLATELLRLHMGDDEADRRDAIVKLLATELGSHEYLIGRREARDIGLKVSDAPPELEKLMWDLYCEYERSMELSKPYSPETVLAGRDLATEVFTRAAVESEETTHLYQTTKQIKRITLTEPGRPPIVAYQEMLIKEGWTEALRVD